MEFRTHGSIRDFREGDWDELLGPDGVPFLRWRFLEALEATGCVQPERGWAPLFCSLSSGGRLLAALPGYVKGNSEGEFVFDHGFAQYAHERLGLAYYPKLIVACPFTPATGPRLLCRAGEDEGALVQAAAAGLLHVARELELSGVHVLFPRPEQARLFERAGFALRLGVQYHWSNPGYQSFDDFLARYDSKRRNQIKRERNELHKQGIELVVRTGSDIDTETALLAYRFYCTTVDKYFWGRRYLNQAFFEEVCSRLKDQILIVLAKERASGRIVGGAFNLLGDRRLFGRYWGASETIRFLHFNVCYYRGIEECIQRRLEVFEPGAGGEHKLLRGFEATATYSAHRFVSQPLERAVRDYLRREGAAIRASIEQEPSPLRPL